MNNPRQIQLDHHLSRPKRDVSQYSQDVHRNAGEFLLRLGSLVRFLTRHGAGLSQTAGEIGYGEKLCTLAITFAVAPDVLKLRALVEDWNVLKIRSELCR